MDFKFLNKLAEGGILCLIFYKAGIHFNNMITVVGNDKSFVQSGE